MATTTRRPEDRRRKPDLTTGFGSLTLDPSPRLRHVREQMSRQDQRMTIQEAWLIVGRAMADAIGTLSRNLKAGR